MCHFALGSNLRDSLRREVVRPATTARVVAPRRFHLTRDERPVLGTVLFNEGLEKRIFILGPLRPFGALALRDRCS